MTPAEQERWIEVSPSQFTHETEGLEIVRQLLPDQAPFRAWSNFEFRDGRGRWHEVDLLVLGRSQLHLVELKYYNGQLRGDDQTWRRDGHRAEDSPLKLARRKAQYFASKITEEFHNWVRETKAANVPPAREIVPFVQESVFLHHPNFQSQLSQASAMGLYGLDGQESRSNLPGISELLLEPPSGSRVMHERILVALMARIGLVQRREREAGSWVIRNEPLAEGEGWQDWQASHRVSHQQQGRIRIQVVPPGATQAEEKRVRKLADHEFRVMSRLSHEGVLRPQDLVESDLGVGLVYPHEDAWQRLDLWMADRPRGLSLDVQLSIIRQLAEALQYAHDNRVVHRGLTPRAVWVRDSDGRVKVQLRDWQSAGGIESAQSGSAVTGVTALFDASKTGPEGDRWLDGFAAPEGAMTQGVDRVRIDVFGLGALAFYLLAGQPAVASASALRDRLREQSGLDLAPELPQVSPALRQAVLDATKASVSERTLDVATFLRQLSADEGREADSEPKADPLEAAPGALLGDRFRLIRRLGAGSTAVGLLVGNPQDETAPHQVLKVALDDAASQRLRDEAEVLRSLRSPRLVSLVEGPFDLGNRWALLLENAGASTLAQELNGRGRLSLDRLERWGTDLLEALVELDRKGIDHRDIKPANLGVRESRGNRAKHLVLFDFSLSKAPASALRAGSQHYLDPFLGLQGRDRYDSAAERYSAAVVLFEMATGNVPVYGDGLSDPASIADEATVTASLFDPAVTQFLVPFFRRALARDAASRHDTANEMLASWQQTFRQTDTGVPDNAAELQAAATPETRLVDAGLSARALSALEPSGVQTVADLVAIDPALLTRLGGAAKPSRDEIKRSAKLWRAAFADIRSSRGGKGRRASILPDPLTASELLLGPARMGRGENRVAFVRLVLGLTGSLPPFATQAQLGAHLPDPVSAARASQLTSELQELWAADEESRTLLIGLGEMVESRLAELGGVATATELADHLMRAMVSSDDAEAAQETRLVTGLVKLVVDRRRAVVRGEGEGSEYGVRRRDGRPVLIGTDAAALDAVDGLGRVADSLVDAVNGGTGHDAVVPPDRVTESLTEALAGAELRNEMREPGRLARLAAGLSTHSAASGVHELHHQGLSQARAVALTLNAVAAGQRLSPVEIRDRVRARFPAVATLPQQGQGLIGIVEDSGLDLVFDQSDRRYRSRAHHHDTTGLESRAPTVLVTELPAVSAHGVVGQRLADSLERRSFLALGAPALSLDRAIEVLATEYAASEINATRVVLGAMRERAEAVGLPWTSIRGADAEPSSSRGGQAVSTLVGSALPVLDEAIDAALASGEPGPVLLTDVAILARYGAVNRLSRWTDLATPRGRSLWLVVPQLHANRGAALDGRPLPLAAPGQFVSIGADWISTRHRALAALTPQEGASA